MIVQCENCHTKYNLPDDKIPADGVKVKCSKCSHTFMVSPPKPAEPEPTEIEEPIFDDSDLAEDDISAGLDDDFDIPDDDSLPADDDEDSLFSSEDEDDQGGDEEEEYYEDDEEEDDEEEEEDEEYYDDDDEFESEDDEYYDDDEEEYEEGSSLGKKIFLTLVVLIVLGGLGAGGAWYMGYLSLPFLDDLIGHENKTEEPAAPPVSMAEQVAKIALKDVKQYYLSNEKAGQLFVVEGKAVNNFTVAKELIKVQATLLDAKDTVLVDKSQMCGNTLSMYQLQMEPREKIEEALNNEVGILANNTFIKPGKSTPFMVVFFNPPKALRAFQVKAVEAHDPPKE